MADGRERDRQPQQPSRQQQQPRRQRPEQRRRKPGKRRQVEPRAELQTRSSARRQSRRAVRRGRYRGAAARLVTMLIIVAVVLLAAAIFFKVTEIQVSGNSLYSAEEVIQASGIETGDNLLALNKPASAGKIQAVLPYISLVWIDRALPGTVVINVVENDAAYMVAGEGGTSWLINSDGRVLEEAPVSAADYPELHGVTILAPEIGKQLETEQEASFTAASQVMKQLETTDFVSHISQIDVVRPFDIVIWYDALYEIHLGGSDELDYKIRYLASILEELEAEQGGVIDLSMEEDSRAVFTPWEAISE